jgi:hypothetical protein
LTPHGPNSGEATTFPHIVFSTLPLHLPNSTELSIINTYASRTSRDRATLWKKIREANFTAEHFIIGGDFNHMEEEEARGKVGKGGCTEERQLPGTT